ncbi:glycosyltransferase family 2 protein [Pseudoalteromonas sp. SaAl2]
MNSVVNLTTVITPVYNSEKYIKRVVECVQQQTVQVLEHILIDDGSSDSSVAILDELAKVYPNVIILKQSNAGAGKARNAGIAIAKGKYIAFLDADDLWGSKKLENQISFMERTRCDFSYSDYFKVTGEGLKELVVTPHTVHYNELLINCSIGCLTAVYNQDSLGKLYMSDIRQGQDWSLWLKITRLGIVAYRSPECDAYYTVSKDSLSSFKLKKLINMFKIYRYSEKLSIIKSLWFLSRHSVNRLRKFFEK